MLRSRFHSLLLVAAVAALSIATHVKDHAIATYQTARAWVVDHVLTAASLAPVAAGKVLAAPERMVRTASAYALRQIRRDRPRIESSFRLCPSI